MKRINVILSVFALVFMMNACGVYQDVSESDVSQDPNTEEEVPETGKTEDQSTMTNITIQIGTKAFKAVLFDNPSTKAFKDKLPMTLDMTELNGNEKYYQFSDRLPSNDEVIGKIKSGDLMLYASSYLVLFYEDLSSSYSYTRLGRIDDPTGLSEAVGSGNISISFKVENN